MAENTTADLAGTELQKRPSKTSRSNDLLEVDSPHQALVLRAERWLKQQNCGVVIRDPFRSSNREQPDAIGWRSDCSIMVECKVSRSDFLGDGKKPERYAPELGMGDWRFYMCPPDVIKPGDLPDGWGLLWVCGKQVRKMHGVPANTSWYRDKPFAARQGAENKMLVSALRRLTLRGRLPEIYDGFDVSRTTADANYIPKRGDNTPDNFGYLWNCPS